jgi:hypothetical protein
VRIWTTKHRLTVRDRRLLSFLAEYGCVSADRIKAQFWGNRGNLRSHYRRLGVLKRQGFIENVLGDKAISIGYRLTKKGKDVLDYLGETLNRPANRRSYKTQFEHDQLMIDLRRILELSPIVKDFRTEAEVRGEVLKDRGRRQSWENLPSIPDATFVFEVPGQKMRVAVELELSGKSSRRYKKIFADHMLSKDWNLVFYVVKNEKLLRYLREILKDTKSKNVHVRVARAINGIYFCLLEEVLSLKCAAAFVGENQEFSLEQLAKNYGL